MSAAPLGLPALLAEQRDVFGRDEQPVLQVGDLVVVLRREDEVVGPDRSMTWRVGGGRRARNRSSKGSSRSGSAGLYTPARLAATAVLAARRLGSASAIWLAPPGGGGPMVGVVLQDGTCCRAYLPTANAVPPAAPSGSAARLVTPAGHRRPPATPGRRSDVSDEMPATTFCYLPSSPWRSLHDGTHPHNADERAVSGLNTNVSSCMFTRPVPRWLRWTFACRLRAGSWFLPGVVGPPRGGPD